MKTRQGFVSNSSSSSFVIIGNSVKEEKLPEKQYIIGVCGETEFGWQFETYDDVHSRINFAYLQAKEASDVQRPIFMQMLFKVLEEKTGYLPIVDGNFNTNGYVDHQSSSSEGMNVEMFEDESTLERFLFDSASYVKTGNDNT